MSSIWTFSSSRRSQRESATNALGVMSAPPTLRFKVFSCFISMTVCIRLGLIRPRSLRLARLGTKRMTSTRYAQSSACLLLGWEGSKGLREMRGSSRERERSTGESHRESVSGEDRGTLENEGEERAKCKMRRTEVREGNTVVG